MKKLIIFQLILISVHILVVQSQLTNIALENASCEVPETENVENLNIKLNFSSMGITDINRNFISSSHVKCLILRNNNIEEFSSNIFNGLPCLEYLDISNNKLSLSKLFSFGEIPSLKSLILGNDIGKDLKNFKNPRSYESLPILYIYPKLKNLSLRNIKLHSIPSDFQNHFPELDNLDLSYNNLYDVPNNLLDSIPVTVTKLILENTGLSSLNYPQAQNISFLNLNKNRFEILTTRYISYSTLNLRNYMHLKTLLVSNGLIRAIDDNAFENTQRLEYLDISYNKLEHIPEGVFSCVPSLLKLDISSNSIEALPNDFSSLSRLTTLNMDKMKNNKIFRSLELLTRPLNIEVLSLRSNELTTIAQSILNNFPRLRELDLNNNKIKFFSIGQWPNTLQKLVLNNNEISDVADLSLEKAKTLKLVELKHNSILVISISIVKEFNKNMFLKL